MNYLDLFQSGFKPGYGAKAVVVVLMDDFWLKTDEDGTSMLALLDLSLVFSTVVYGMLFNCSGS